MKSISRITVVVSFLCLALAAQPVCVLSQAPPSDSGRKNYQLVNGKWFNGKSFQPQTFYSVDGILAQKKPRGEVETLDLANKFVVPPFAEAHNSTHINSAADFATAVRAGVDEINHLPGYSFEQGTGEADYLIQPEVAKSAARQGTTVVTTASVALLYAKGEALAKVQAVQRKNLRLLKQAGVRIAVGSDNYTDTSVEEAMYLKSLDVFDNAELLNMWSVTSAETIFPRRKIGSLREGYEANFLVLRGNPLESFEHVKDIELRFKQGLPISPAP
jgi:imidazolonepropionase-like amidohydrolase